MSRLLKGKSTIEERSSSGAIAGPRRRHREQSIPKVPGGYTATGDLAGRPARQGIVGQGGSMALRISYDMANVDWQAVDEVFRLAPLGRRDPEKFQQACARSAVVV